MSIFTNENIISEDGLTATTSVFTTMSVNSITATTIQGDGSNLTNINSNLVLTNPNNSIQFNNSDILSGSSNFIYSGNTLSFTGDSVFNGLFYKLNSPSVKQVHQWGGTVTAGITPGIIWTNMSAGTKTWLHSGANVLTNDANYITDLTEYTECRLFTSMQVAGARTGTSLTVQYFNNETVQFETLVSVTIGNTTGVKDSGWISIPIIAKTETTIRLIGSNGDPSALIDPRFSPPILLIR